jgi:DNA sulfur modification protein DndE
MQSVKTSEANKSAVTELTQKLGMGPENVIARIAFAHSLSLGERLSTKNMSDSKGKEYSVRVLFGDYAQFYLALVCQLYGLHKADPDISKYVKLHLDHGLSLLGEAARRNENMSVIDFVIRRVEDGTKALL